MALIPVEEALRQILKGVKALGSETVVLQKSIDRVIAKAISAKRDQPPFPASAMDGYAVRYDDVRTLPTALKVIGVSAAGHAFKGTVKAGEAVRILTGAPVPRSADTVVIQENVEKSGNKIVVLQSTSKAKNIRKRGLDFIRGAELVPHLTKMNARDIGVAAAGHNESVSVYRKPTVTLFTTGDELVLPGQRARADQIVSSNNFAIEAAMQKWGATVVNLGIIKDDLKATKAAIRKGLSSDILVTTGGASVGDHDYVQEALKSCGVNIGFWKIALRPGKPLMFGTKGKTRVLGLPGNPVSAFVCSRIFLKPLIEAMQGMTALEFAHTAILDGELPENDGRQDYMRATLKYDSDGQARVLVFPTQDSSQQRTLRNADCLVIRKPFEPVVRQGELVKIMLLDS